jgi:GntR family transcriptional regulator
LETEGVIFRRQGSGTFANETGLQIKTRIEEIWDYETVLKVHGYAPSTRILSIREEPADVRLAEELGLDVDDVILLVEKAFLADNSPVILTCNYIPMKIVQRPYTRDDFHLPFYQFLSDYCRQDLVYYLSEIKSVAASDRLADELDLPDQKTSLLSFDELGYNQNSEPIVNARSFFRDDILRLRLIRRRV